MTCSETQELLVAFLDGETSSDERSAIEDHLGTCPACRQEADELQGTAAFFRSAAPVEPSVTWDLALAQKLSMIRIQELTDELTGLRHVAEELSARLRRMEELAAAPPAEPSLMTVDEVAAYLHVTPEKVYDLLEDLPRVEMNYDVRFRKSSVDRWLETQEKRPRGDEGFQWSDWIYGNGPHLTS